MKLKKRDFAFFVLGGLMFLLGSLFTPFQNKLVEAQNTDVKVFDMIKCRGLLVVDAAGEPKVVLSVGKDGGGVSVFNKIGEVVGMFGPSSSGRGVLTVAGKDILKSRGIGSAQLSATPYGGTVSIFNKDGKNVGNFGVNSLGDGGLQTKDKNGYKTGRIP
ncbi:MAG: hypothetical protein OXI63_06145 [Candidatus Poribacteria bacterium]|nr:hypothetical protein [Candidatus Poribacteria bacterium]